jgi:hypothetical protein
MEFYSAIKKNEILSFAGKWMGMENIMLCEVSQVWKKKGHMFPLICGRQMQIQALSYIHMHTEHVSNGGTVQGN